MARLRFTSGNSEFFVLVLVCTWSMSSTLTVLTAEAAAPFKVVRTLQTSDGSPFSLFERTSDDGDGGSVAAVAGSSPRGSNDDKLRPTRYYSPSAVLVTSSARREFNPAADRHEVTFDVEMWSDGYAAEVARAAGVPRDSLAVLPAAHVRLVAEDLDPAKYSVPRSFQPFEASPKTVKFVIRCSEKRHCGALKSQFDEAGKSSATKVATSTTSSTSSPASTTTSVPSPSAGSEGGGGGAALPTMQVELSDATRATSSVVPVTVADHVAPTVVFRKVQAVGGAGGEVLLTEADLNEFVEEVMARVLAGGQHRAGGGSSLGNVELAAPTDAAKVIRAGLIDGEVAAAAVPDWNKLLWPSDRAPISRPDKLSQLLNQAFPPDPSNSSLFLVARPFSDLDPLQVPKLTAGARKTLKSQVLNWLPGYSSGLVEWRRDTFRPKSAAKLYAVNVANLKRRDGVAHVRVDVYPPEATIRFPLTVPRHPSPSLLASKTGDAAAMSKSFETRLAELKREMQRQIDDLKLELRLRQDPNTLTKPSSPSSTSTSASSWPAGDYCLLFPRNLAAGYDCPAGFVVVHPSRADFERGLARFSRPGKSNPWLINFTCCTQNKEPPTSSHTL